MGLIRAIAKALFSSSTKKIISIQSTGGLKFWVYLDNILQNSHSESSISIIDIPVDEDARSLLEITIDYGNGTIAKSKAEKVVLTSTHKYYTVKADKKKIVLKSARAFEVEVEEKCKGVKPQYDDDETSKTSRKQPAQKSATAAKPQAEKVTPASPSRFCSKSKFDELMATVKEQHTDEKRKAAIKKIISTNNLKSSQLAELVEILYFEEDKFEMLKYAFAKSNDKKNFSKTLTILSYDENREYFLNKMEKEKKTTKPNPPSKPKEKSQIDEYVEAVKALHNQEEMKKAIKKIISANKLTASQIKQLVSIVIFDKDKLELLKFAYHYCKDKKNYIKTASILTLSSDKKQILEMVE